MGYALVNRDLSDRIFSNKAIRRGLVKAVKSRLTTGGMIETQGTAGLLSLGKLRTWAERDRASH